MFSTNFPPLQQALIPETKNNTWLRFALLAIAGSVLLAISAKISLPFYPVPFTLQPLAVLMIGMAFGSRLAAATLGLYLLEGIMGLPVFFKGAGWAYFTGTTGGYLVGFLVAATVVGWLAERGFDRTFLKTALTMFVGLCLIYLFGLSWLATIIGFEKALTLGFVPFILADLVKLVIAAFAMPATWKLLGR